MSKTAVLMKTGTCLLAVHKLTAIPIIIFSCSLFARLFKMRKKHNYKANGATYMVCKTFTNIIYRHLRVIKHGLKSSDLEFQPEDLKEKNKLELSQE